MMRNKFLCLVCLVSMAACHNDAEQLFESLPAEKTGIDFVNHSLDRKDFNIFNYRNFYNGGGVAIGDINNDGLADIFVTSNFEQNKLYLNKGHMQFEDITQKAGILGKKFWSTGVTFADVNGDGFLDIYVCNSGSRDARGNQLYINNGNLTFTEKAKEYGLEDGGFSTHAAFFDYDRDGDLDMYLLNNSFTPIDKLGYANLRNTRDKLGGHKLFRNDGDHFTDVSEQAGIYGSLIGFGLGITIGDVNNDNWPDIYISNDFYERDYLYINQKDGTFKESLETAMGHTSMSSMGADIADINNDGNLDIFITDMLPESDYRLKTTMVFEGYELTKLKESRDFYHQYSRNMMHVNNGDGTFSELGCLAGVQATDWSWGALLFDMDNDGKKDVFVANGILKDLTDQDFVAFLADESNIQDLIEGRKKFDYKEYINKMSSQPIPNFAFKNEGNYKFTNKANDWGLGKPSFSNGSAYGDLDNDGDLDLVVNNNDSPLSVFKNLSTEKFKKHFLRVKLKGTNKNLNGIGTKVYIYQKGQLQYLQQMPNRGFQSSSDEVLVFGLGDNPQIDSLKVIWSDDKKQLLKNPKADADLTLDYKNANLLDIPKSIYDIKNQKFSDITFTSGLDFLHEENEFVDYNRDGLLKQMYSRQGPSLAVGDVNGDGLDDVYMGGGIGKPRKLFLQKAGGKFEESKQAALQNEFSADDVAATFFDADGDKDLDLYVATGGNEYEPNNPFLADRLYLNDGKGNFTESNKLPLIFENNSCVVAADFDHDGDQDLFVGARLISGQYGLDPKSHLLVNDGKGNFQIGDNQMPEIGKLGMVTDAVWTDIDGDKLQDLIVVGDWMPIMIFKNDRGKGMKFMGEVKNSSGFWNTIKSADIDGDGDMDFIVGNLGLNSRIKATVDKPATLSVNDFEHNGLVEQIISCYNNDKCLPMLQKPDLQKVLPSIKKKFVLHKDYAGKTVDEIFTSDQKKGMITKTANNLQTSFMINNGKGGFELTALPIEAQFSPIYGIETVDYDHDGQLDILLAGNFFDLLSEMGRYDANYGLILKGKGKGQFDVVMPKESGFFVKGQVRKMKLVKGLNQTFVVLAKNSDKAQIFKF